MLFESPGNSFAYLCKPSLGLSPSYAILVQCEIFCPSHLPFDDACIVPLSLPYDPLPLQNFVFHNLISRRQSVVVLTVEMVYHFSLSVIGAQCVHIGGNPAWCCCVYFQSSKTKKIKGAIVRRKTEQPCDFKVLRLQYLILCISFCFSLFIRLFFVCNFIHDHTTIDALRSCSTLTYHEIFRSLICICCWAVGICTSMFKTKLPGDD